MPTDRRRVALALVGLLWVLAAGCGGVRHRLRTRHRRRARERDQSFREPISRLVLDSDVGAVGLVARPDGEVSVQQRLPWTDSKPQVSMVVEDGILRVRAECPQPTDRCEVGFTIRLPAATGVDVTTQAGSVEAEGLAGDLRLRGSAGSVSGTGLLALTVDAQTSAGNIELGFAEPPQTVTAEAMVGSVDIAVPQDENGYRVDAATTVGQRSVQVTVDPASERRITAKSTAGSVTLRYP